MQLPPYFISWHGRAPFADITDRVFAPVTYVSDHSAPLGIVDLLEGELWGDNTYQLARFP